MMTHPLPRIDRQVDEYYSMACRCCHTELRWVYEQACRKCGEPYCFRCGDAEAQLCEKCKGAEDGQV